MHTFHERVQHNECNNRISPESPTKGEGSVRLTIHLFLHPIFLFLNHSINPSVFPYIFRLFVYLSLFIFFCDSDIVLVYLFNIPAVYQCIYPTFLLYIDLSACLSVCLSVCLTDCLSCQSINQQVSHSALSVG
jgi:hypothetical protein